MDGEEGNEFPHSDVKMEEGETDGKDKTIPGFITKLLAMINDPSIKHLISWTEKGDTFKVHNSTLLARDVLPKYYKHSNFTSLVRQLNMYGFHKVVGVDQGGLKGNSDQHPDEKIVLGVPYNVTYLGSVEIEYIPNNPPENNKIAIETIRYLLSEKPAGEDLVLTVAAGRIVLASADNTRIVMRHSTSRIAYSTVDTSNKKLFCYVALSRKSPTPLCHIFITPSPRVSYELTFTCAQAFDVNFKTWQKNAHSAQLKACASESGDVDPTNARKSPLMARKQFPAQEAPRQSPLSLTALADAIESQQRPKTKLQPGDRVGDARQVEPVPASMLDVEDEHRLQEDDEAFFTALASARSMPNMLDIGVEPEEFNEVLRNETNA